ncbi:type I-G CRISPR-associated protein, Cas3-extension family [Millisia brevis]|uniref:type I-G CRISPR-associated protein, Cas3-extension family n=1 Tax=Millisia brevis TaxID=264148 RepID=UPI00082A0255|nr:hypothetical protein [Millisia brevis]
MSAVVEDSRTDTVQATRLRGDTAHGFLAALGVLQAARRIVPGVRLSWSEHFRPRAVLHGTTRDQLISAILADRDARMTGAVLNHPADAPFDTLKCGADGLTAWATRIGELADDDPDVDLWSALVIEGGFDNSGKAKPTHFDFSAGQVKFLKVVREIGGALTPNLLEEAITGPWRYESALSTLRFEAEGERIGALRAVPPSTEKLLGVPGADWLAFLGLAFYPLTLAPGRDRARVVTAACDTDWNAGAFRWPTWIRPLDHPTVAAVVTDPTLIGENVARCDHRPQALRARGIAAVWQCGIGRSGQGYGSFGPPKRIASAD